MRQTSPFSVKTISLGVLQLAIITVKITAELLVPFAKNHPKKKLLSYKVKIKGMTGSS